MGNLPVLRALKKIREHNQPSVDEAESSQHKSQVRSNALIRDNLRALVRRILHLGDPEAVLSKALACLHEGGEELGTLDIEGLHYIHNHNSHIIHRDLNCKNIFVNGNSGVLKIGDLGFAAILTNDRDAHTIIGTPEFMVPKLYEDVYDEHVDVYSFGMSLLEMVTLEIPYSKCHNAAHIYKKVSYGIKATSLQMVIDLETRKFIEKFLAPALVRSSAIEILVDPFFRGLQVSS